MSKKKMAEQVQMRLLAIDPILYKNVQEEDIYEAIGQKVNSLLKAEHFNVTLPSGQRTPDNLMLASYDGVAVVSYKDRARCTLPVTPVTLPRNLGIYAIEDEDGQVQFIPLMAGQRILLQSQEVINDLLGQVGYQPLAGRLVEFTKDITLLGINKVNFQLAVFDISVYSENDTLPIPADKEEVIINELVQQFAPSQEKADAKEYTKK
jgi:hypothetical protein